MTTLRQGIRYGELQTDLDCKGFVLRNVGGVEDIRSKVVIIDVAGDDSSGEVGTGLPFLTLGAALAAINTDQHLHPDDHSGYFLVMRPGIYPIDGMQEVHVSKLVISAYGAQITSAVSTTETTKLTITSSDILIEGLELVGPTATPTPGSLTNGAIEINGGGNVVLRDLKIHDYSAAAIYGVDRYGGLVIEGCTITNCQNGIFLNSSSNDLTTLRIQRNVINSCKSDGIIGLGSNNSTTRKGLVGLNIFDNVFGQNASHGINLSEYVRDVNIERNYVQGSENAIFLGKAYRSVISGNIIWNCTTPLLFDGCQAVTIGDNLIDGRNALGNSVTANAIQIDGFYVADGDGGPYEIAGNTIVGLGSLRRAIYCLSQNDVLITGNRLHGLVFLQDANQAQVKGNTIVLDNNNACVTIQAFAADCVGIEIQGNRFIGPIGGPLDQIIKTNTVAPFVITALFVVGNTSLNGRTYAVGTINHTGDAPTAQYVDANQPPSPDPQLGWVNDAQKIILPNTVIVSQLSGNDTTGLRERGDMPFLTINAAITAASSGDTVRVLDGTFNERLDAKDGITVEFVAAAKLVCTSASGCIRTTASDQAFTVIHKNTPMVCTTAAAIGILSSHAGCVLKIYGGISVTGSWAVNATAGAIKIYDGDISSVNAAAIRIISTDALIEVRRGRITTTGTYAINVTDGTVRVFDCRIEGEESFGVVAIDASAAQHIYVNCTFVQMMAANGCIYFATVGAVAPVFQNCVLVSAFGATESMRADSAQNVYLYGDVVADYGPNPPTNITFLGPGSYDVVVPIVEVQN